MANFHNCSGHVGIGAATGHHGELLQGEFTYHGGVYPALVTLPIASLRSTAEFISWDDDTEIHCSGCAKARRAAETTMEYLRLCQPEVPVAKGGSTVSQLRY